MNVKQLAFLILVSLTMLCGCTDGDRMLAELERLEEQNRSDVPFTSDSAALRLVDYYDRWYRLPTAANRNLLMRAYYMLGSAYRDMGEAPAALHYFDIATQQVDTTHIDSANAATLFRVYGQMATIYGQQDMPVEKRDAILHYKRYALKAKDTLSYIIAYEQMTDVCYQLDDTLGVYAYTDSAYLLYKNFGYNEHAARVYPTAIYISLISGHYQKATRYMETFENESGLFDEQGNIEEGREHYYYSKGLYCLSIGDKDSADYYFRRLISYGYPYEAHKGLLSIYRLEGNSDSIAKYSSLFEEAMLQWETQRQTEAIIQSSALYKYERNQNQALTNAQRAERYKFFVITSVIVTLLILLYTYYIYRQRSKRQERKLRQLNEAYQRAQSEYEQLTVEYLILKDTYDHSEVSSDARSLIEGKQIRIEKLEKELDTYKTYLDTLKYTEREKLLKGNDVVIYFIRKTHITPNWQAPREDRWKALSKVYSQYMPVASACMDKAELSKQERSTCILTHLDFTPGDIAILLDTSASRISNAKKDACKKLFRDGDVSLLRKRIIEMEA